MRRLSSKKSPSSLSSSASLKRERSTCTSRPPFPSLHRFPFLLFPSSRSSSTHSRRFPALGDASRGLSRGGGAAEPGCHQPGISLLFSRDFPVCMRHVLNNPSPLLVLLREGGNSASRTTPQGRVTGRAFSAPVVRPRGQPVRVVRRVPSPSSTPSLAGRHPCLRLALTLTTMHSRQRLCERETQRAVPPENENALYLRTPPLCDGHTPPSQAQPTNRLVSSQISVRASESQDSWLHLRERLGEETCMCVKRRTSFVSQGSGKSQEVARRPRTHRCRPFRYPCSPWRKHQ